MTPLAGTRTNRIVVAGVSVCVLAAPAPAVAEDAPPPGIGWSSLANNGDGTIDIGGKAAEEDSNRKGALQHSPRVRIERDFLPKCAFRGEVIMAGTASCDPVPCQTSDGRSGVKKTVETRRVDADSGDPLSGWQIGGDVCEPDETAGAPSLESQILQEFRSLELPGLVVRTRPAGRTLVNLPTEFVVERPAKDRELPRILGHRVTVAITPVEYRWTFGDGAARTTSGRGAESVRHTYAAAGSVAASVETAYRARYRVDGGDSRRIPGTVAVTGPVTAVEVVQARSQLVAPPNPQ